MLIVALSLLLQAPQDVGAQLDAIRARVGDRARELVLGTSAGGRPIQGLALAGTAPASPDQRPAVLIVAGVHGEHRLGTALALHHAARLVDAGDDAARDLLQRCTFYVVPQLDPDGAALGRAGNAAGVDLDRDGRAGEDGPDDLDGDGHIAQMRWRDPDGEWIADPDEPRLLRKADPARGERGVYRLATEGHDDDGDGQRDEDPPAGTALYRGFSHDFPTFDREAGGVPVGQPETRALADFVFGHRNIALAVVYGVDDNLLGAPKTDKGDRRAPLRGILQDDLALYQAAGALYRERTGREGSARDRHDGSVWSWLYCDAGIIAFATDVWRLPEAKKGKDAKSAARLALEHCDAIGRGFVPWHELKHPDLGTVEVGGFVQQLDSALLADDRRDALLASHHAFLLELCGWLPHCTIAELSKKALAGGAYQIEATVRNDGRMPALTAIGRKCRRFPAPRLRLDAGKAAIVAGDPRPRVGTLRGLGGSQRFRWIVSGSPGDVVKLALDSDFAGRDQREVTL